jgi:hypothetical protein
MKQLLVIIFALSFINIKAQFCSTTGLVNMGAITPTTSMQSVAANSGAKRYWTFNAVAGCTYTLSTCTSTNTNDTYLRLYSGTTPSTAFLVTSNDDNGPVCTGTKASIVWVCPTSGAYSILFTNYSCANISSNSNFTFRRTCAAPSIPNDACANATNISSLPYSSGVLSTSGAVSDVPTSTSGCSTFGSNVWYKVVGNNSQLTASTCNASTNFDTEIRVYTGSCGTLNSMVEVVCNDDDASCTFSTVRSKVTWCSNNGVTYYITVGYYATTAVYGNYVLSVTSGAICSNLPIELTSFEGKSKNRYNDLTWTTATETKNDYYELERSTDGLNWNIVANINGAGTVSTPSFYSFKDYTFVNNTVNYYRLKQVDTDKSFTYSNIIYIDNKVSEQLVDLIKITDVLGRTVTSDYQGLVLYYYSDGKVVKVFQ